MTKHDQASLRKYFRSISGLLPCPGKQKRMILQSAKENVSAFLEDHPDADFSQVEAHFGAPEQIASAFVADMDMPKLLNALRGRKRIFLSVIAALITALLLWGGGVAIAVADQNAANPNYIVDDMQQP